MKRLIAAVLGGFLLAANALAENAENGPFAPFEFLAGWCWQGTFPDGKNVDTHCYEDVFGGAFIRDRHVVKGPNPDYRGETLFYRDKKAGVIRFLYWNSLGGASAGTAEPQASGEIVFPETYTGEDGKIIEIRSVLRPLGGDSYLAVSEEKRDGAWVESWRIEFRRLAPAAPATLTCTEGQTSKGEVP